MISYGAAPAVGTRNSRTVPFGLIRPILSPSNSVNQTLPSGPVAISNGLARRVGTRNCRTERTANVGAPKVGTEESERGGQDPVGVASGCDPRKARIASLPPIPLSARGQLWPPLAIR